MLTSLADDESIPTIRCSTCSEWHHRPCISISENKDQRFVCQRCNQGRRNEAEQLGDQVHPDTLTGEVDRVKGMNRKGSSFFEREQQANVKQSGCV